MLRLAALLVLILGFMAAGQARAQSQVETLWNCKDQNGRTILTNQQADTAGKDCRIVQQQRVNVVPATKAAARSPTGFPRESQSDRAASRAKQKDTIQQELTQEEAMLADARKKLSDQEAIRTGDEKNYAKVLERLKPYKDTVEVHQKNVEALKRELSNLSR
jgi:hypothetical protein